VYKAPVPAPAPAANQRAFLSASQAADARAGRRGSGHR